MVKFLLFAAVALLIAWIYLRLKQDRDSGTQEDRQLPVPDSGFHAVSIRFSETACAAAKRRAGERYLASDSPDLPLKDCDVTRCDCYFTHYEDRRTGRDRRVPFNPVAGGSGTGMHEIERRQSGGRREDD